MSDRCEPPEHLRGVDGWHWVQPPVGNPHLARWHAAERLDVEPLWTSTHHVYSGTPRYAVREWGWRYVAPVTPPATVAALVEALEECANDLEAYVMRQYSGDVLTPGNALRRARDLAPVDAARAALAAYREAAR